LCADGRIISIENWEDRCSFICTAEKSKEKPTVLMR